MQPPRSPNSNTLLLSVEAKKESDKLEQSKNSNQSCGMFIKEEKQWCS